MKINSGKTEDRQRFIKRNLFSEEVYQKSSLNCRKLLKISKSWFKISTQGSSSDGKSWRNYWDALADRQLLGLQSAWEVGAEAKAIPANFTTTYFEGNFVYWMQSWWTQGVLISMNFNINIIIKLAYIITYQ